MDPPPPPQHLVDEAERARMSARGRYRGSFSRRMATSPAWAGMIPQPPRPRLTDAQRSAVEAAFADCVDSDEEEYAAGAAAAAVAGMARRRSLPLAWVAMLTSSRRRRWIQPTCS